MSVIKDVNRMLTISLLEELCSHNMKHTIRGGDIKYMLVFLTGLHTFGTAYHKIVYTVVKDACTHSINTYATVMLYKYIPLKSNQR